MSDLIVKRECDITMARSKWLLPCDKNCKMCMACIETTSTGERRHCTSHRNMNVALDFKIATAGLEPESMEKKEPRKQKQWTDIEVNRLLFLKKQGLTWTEIGKRMGRSMASVQQRYVRVISEMNGEEEP